MTEFERLNYLKIALRIIGAIATFGFYPLTVFWPSGWAWTSGRSEYLEMIIALYATLGIFLLIASRKPEQHVGLVSFAIWSSIARRSGCLLPVTPPDASRKCQNPSGIFVSSV